MDTEKEELYDAFISYNHTDVEFAEKLAKRIESEQYLGRHLRCFFDQWDIQAGENILIRLEQGEKRSRFVCLIMSPEWAKSNWTTLERVMPVFEDPAGLKARVIPILRRSCEVPPSVQILKWFDFRVDNNFENEAKRLVSRLRGESPRRMNGEFGGCNLFPFQYKIQCCPSLKTKALTNLFPLLKLPRLVHYAHSKVKSRSEIWPTCR